MAKFKVEVGGFVTVFRNREIIVYADDEAEAKEKAINKFIDIQQQNGINVCEEGTVNSIMQIK